jgi:methylenetetrahydrofolate--tRNA-(uracil-5-)-methyltransferase
VVPPAETALGSLVNHLTQSDPKKFQPSNVNFGLFPAWPEKVKKKIRGLERSQLALAKLAQWRESENI